MEFQAIIAYRELIIMKKGSKKIILGILALTSIFLISYMATDIYIKAKTKGKILIKHLQMPMQVISI